MLQDTQSVRYYQKLTDALVDLSHRNYSRDSLRLYLDGYLAALRQTKSLEPYLINRLEEDTINFLYDPSSFLLSGPQTQTQTQTEADYYY